MESKVHWYLPLIISLFSLHSPSLPFSSQVKDIEINDLVMASGVDKLLSHWRSDALHPRETGSCMVSLSMNVKTDDDAR